MKALFKAIKDRAVAANNFYAALSYVESGTTKYKFYLNAAPQSISKPYAVFTLITNTATYNFTSTFDDSEIQIDIIDDNNTSDILDLAEKCMTDFDDCTLTVAGYQFMIMERDFNFLTEDPEEEIQRYTIQYLVSTRK